MDVCAKLRGILKERRVGHGGTLDPMATGVLPVFVGNATKAVQFAENGQKEYLGGLRLGVITDTQDITGNILESRFVDNYHITPERVRDVMKKFTGEIDQIPPMYSAVKINGQKLYQLARKGREIPRPPRRVIIYELELLKQENRTDFLFRCLCSKGTYIRTLCYDLGMALGCGGALYSLRRTMAAGFHESEAVTLSEIETITRESGDCGAFLRPADSLFAAYPAYTAPSPDVERRVLNGNPFRVREPVSNGIYRVYAQNGAFLCLSDARNGVFTSRKNFF